MINCAVCMATYNGGDFLEEQISSILSQLRSDEVLFISDDGSSDSTVTIIQSYGDNVRLISNSRAGGVVPNFERALAAAYKSNARIIVLADQDDKWLPGRMDSIRSHLADADMLMMNGFITDSALNLTGNTIFEKLGVRRGFIRNFTRPTYVGCCMAFRREVLSNALPFPEHLPWHDWFISLIGELFFRVKLDQTPLIYYRRHNANQTITGMKSNNSLLKKFIMRYFLFVALVIVIYRHLRVSSLQ